MAATEATLYEIRKGAAWITLNRPERRNALSPQLMTEIHDHVKEADADDNVRCIVLTGAGVGFCAGADLQDPSKKGVSEKVDNGSDRQVPFTEVLIAILDCSKPVIAAVNGSAFGGGLGLIGAADIVVANADAKFSFSEVRIGVIPAIISVVCLPKIGRHHGMKLFLTGERFSGRKAVELGLAHIAISDDELVNAVEEQVDMIGLGGPKAVVESKKLVRRVMELSEAEAFDETLSWSAAMFQSEEAAEGMSAFRDKRKPAWVLAD